MSSEILLGASCRDDDCEAKRGALHMCITSSIISMTAVSRRENTHDWNAKKL